MKTVNLKILLVLVIAVLLPACTTARAGGEKVQPSVVEAIEGSEFSRVTLTEKAVERLDIQTTLVSTNGNQEKVVPYAAVMYGLNGETWTYTNPESRVYVRQVIVIDRIEGDLAVLTEGPEDGTPVVTVGASLLYGAEVGVSK